MDPAGMGELLDFVIKYGFAPVGVVVLWKAQETFRKESAARDEANHKEALERENDLHVRVRELEDYIRETLHETCDEVKKEINDLREELRNKRETRRARQSPEKPSP